MSSSPSLAQCCVNGVTWEGTPEGQVRKINGVDVYVAEPKEGGDKSKAVLFLTDIFGLDLINNKLLADDYARQGYYTYVVDYLNGDAVHKDAMNTGKFDFMGWLAKHGEEATHAALDPVIDGLKEQGVSKFAAVGYCFGGKYTVRLAIHKRIALGMIAHPSLLQIPADLESLKKVTSDVPMLFITCTTDQQYPPEAQKTGDDILGNGSMEGEGYKRLFYEGCTHGFAVRGDKSDPKVKFGKEDAFKQTIEWFKKNGF